MKRAATTFYFILVSFVSLGQLPVDSIRQEDIEKTLNYLTADSLKGRGNFTPELYTAAQFIQNEFQQAGLKTFAGFDKYLQPFQIESRKETKKDSSGVYDPSKTLVNVVGVLEGRAKRGEVMIFSAHYDHIGLQKNVVCNGANDNASGTAALLALAGYFASRNDNERTLIFCAFAGEELGLHGSTAFVPFVNADSVVAVINIEMIGKTFVGKDAFFVTGNAYSNLDKIIEKNLKGKARIRREPDIDKELFKRSDNYPFALKGIPAHSIMSSDDSDPCYHSPCDDVKNLDIKNMTNLIRFIAIGTQTLISGKDRPKRIRVSEIN
jgi:Zn-dependent M28 family amino/carboxypeptidase